MLPPLPRCSRWGPFSSSRQQPACCLLSKPLTFWLQLAEASLQQEAGEAVQTAASVGKTAKDDLQQWALRLPVGVRRLLAGGLAGQPALCMPCAAGLQLHSAGNLVTCKILQCTPDLPAFCDLCRPLLRSCRHGLCIASVVGSQLCLTHASQVAASHVCKPERGIVPAGAISKTVTAPVETLRMQVMSGKVRVCHHVHAAAKH